MNDKDKEKRWIDIKFVNYYPSKCHITRLFLSLLMSSTAFLVFIFGSKPETKPVGVWRTCMKQWEEAWNMELSLGFCVRTYAAY